MRRQKIVIPIALALLSFGIMLVASPLRAMSVWFLSGFVLSMAVEFIVYFIFTAAAIRFAMKRGAARKYAAIAILIGASAADVVLRTMDFQETLISLPVFICRVGAILLGWWFTCIGSARGRALLAICSTAIYALIIAFAFPMWDHKVYFGSYGGKVSVALETPLSFVTPHGTEVSAGDLYGEYLVLDFWSTGCGSCYRQMPELQELYDEIRDVEGVSLYSVCCIRTGKENHETGESILNKRGYTLPILSTDFGGSVMKKLDITAVPTMVILDKSGNVIFKGSPQNGARYIRKLLE